MVGLIPKAKPSSLKPVISKAKTNFGFKAGKSTDLKILLFENGILWTLEGRQNGTLAHRALVFLLPQGTNKIKLL